MRIIMIFIAAIAITSCKSSSTIGSNSNTTQANTVENNTAETNTTIDLSTNTSSEVMQLGTMTNEAPAETDIKNKKLKKSEKAEMNR